MSLQLRDASPADIPDLARVIAAAFEIHRGKFEPPSSSLNKSPEAVRKELEQDSAILALQGNDVVACVFFRPEDDYIYLGRLAVLPAYQRQGIARKLMQEVERRALAMGYTKVRLSVRLPLKDTRAFYEAVGYKEHSLGTHAGSTEPTYVKLEKTLGF